MKFSFGRLGSCPNVPTTFYFSSRQVQVIGHRVREAVPATPLRVGIPVGGAANATPPSATLQFNNFSPSPNNRSGITHAAAAAHGEL